MGYIRGGRPDTERAKRVLGLTTHDYSRGYGPRHRTGVRLATAEKLADALHLDPVDAGF